jgi:hypothetical protein
MEMKKKLISFYYQKTALISGFISLVITYFLYKPYFVNSSEYLIGFGGDFLKNYFTPAYFVKYDKGTWFSGMNYPYGEIVTFTDNQPILSWILSFLNTWFPIADHTIGILNIMLVTAPMISAMILCRILKIHGLSVGFQIFGSIVIAFMAPQALRLHGHYGLAYSWVIPGIWYLLLMIEKYQLKRWLWVAICAGFILFCGFLHPYYAVIGVLFAGSYGLIRYIRTKELSLLIGYLVATLAALAVFLLIQSQMDPYSDRPKLPWGTHYYHASLEGLLAPAFGPIQPLFQSVFNTAPEIEYERRIYLGLVFIIVILSGIYRFFWRIKWVINKKSLPGINLQMKDYLWISVLIFSVASGLMHDLFLDRLQEKVSAIAQFRTLGRFAWIIYYLMSVYAVFCMYRWYRLLKMKGLPQVAGFIIFLLSIIWLYEAYTFQKHVSEPLFNSNIYFNKDNQWIDFFEREKIDPDVYQAIWVNPIVLNGSEKVDRGRGHWTMKKAMQISYSTGLPIINIIMSRTSAQMVSSFLELYTPDYIAKERMNDFNDKPILMLGIEEEILLPEELALIHKSTYLGFYDEIFVYKLDPKTLFIKEIPESCREHTDTINLPTYYNGFETSSSEFFFADRGSITIQLKDSFELIDQIDQMIIPDSSILYWAHIWVKLNPKTLGMPEVQLREFVNGDQLLTVTPFEISEVPFAQRGWVRMSAPFRLDQQMKKLQVLAKGKGNIFDGLGVFPADHIPCRQLGPDQWLYGNIWIDHR